MKASTNSTDTDEHKKTIEPNNTKGLTSEKAIEFNIKLVTDSTSSNDGKSQKELLMENCN